MKETNKFCAKIAKLRLLIKIKKNIKLKIMNDQINKQ